MSPEDLKDYGDNAIQMRCNFGILIQACVKGKLVCIKRPFYLSSSNQLLKISKSISIITGIIEYKDFLRLKDTVYYEKVKYNPLRSKKLIQCLYNFIPAVVNIVKLLQQKHLIHGDMRVPNICFNEDYKPVLIDFDISSKYSLPFINLQI